MIDFNSLREKMSEEEIKKLDSGLARLRVLTPEAREQILMAMEAMINCENLKTKNSEVIEESHSEDKLCIKKLSNSLKSKYDELKDIAKCSEGQKFHELKALAKILKIGTYEEGAKAIDLLVKINLIKYYIDPKFLLESIEDNKVED